MGSTQSKIVFKLSSSSSLSLSSITTKKRIIAQKLQYWMEKRPIASNCILCLNLWIAGDTLAQYLEYKLLQSSSSSSSSSSKNYDNHNQHEPSTTTITTARTTDTALSLNNSESFPQPLSPIPSPSSSSSSTTACTTSTSSFSSSFSYFVHNQYEYRRTVECATFGAFIIGPIIAVWYPFLERLCQHLKIASRRKYGKIWGPPIFKMFADELFIEPLCMTLFFGYMAGCEQQQQCLRQRYLQEHQQCQENNNDEIQKKEATTTTMNMATPPAATATVVTTTTANTNTNNNNQIRMSSLSLFSFSGWKESFQNKMNTQFFPTWYTALSVWPIVLLGTFRFVPIYGQAPVINTCCIVWDGYLSYRNTLSKMITSTSTSTSTTSTTTSKTTSTSKTTIMIQDGGEHNNKNNKMMTQ